MSMSLELIIIGVVALISLCLNLLLILWFSRLSRHYNSLTADLDKKTLIRFLEGIQKTLSEHERNQVISKNELKKLKEEITTHLQTLTVKRFNPFSDTGGDQSFIMAILDGNSDGVVITSLHSRENTRFYVKSVKGGVGVDHPLSSEEQKIIKR